MKIETALCLALAVRLLPDEPRIAVEMSPYVDWNREKLVYSAIVKGSTHLMMIDTDMIFPVDGILRLAAWNADVAYGTYNRKNRERPEPLKDATGFMLINLESLKEIKPPYFVADLVRTGVGEDVFFCQNARAAGLRVVQDSNIEIGHIGRKVY